MTPNLQVRYITADGKLTREGMALFAGLLQRLDEAEGKLAAIAAVTGPSGGGTIDAQARTAINAIIAGAA